jgi:hypothetical protein
MAFFRFDPDDISPRTLPEIVTLVMEDRDDGEDPVTHAFAVLLATNKRYESANAARAPMNMANSTLARDAVQTGAAATRGTFGQYPDHSPSDSETSDSESAPSETDLDGAGAAAAVA